MSRSTFVVTVLSLVLAATFVFAQQAGQQTGQQPGQQQQQWQSGGAGGGSAGQTGGAMQQRMAAGAQRAATIAEQQNIDLYKAVQAAEQQAKGKAIAAVLFQPQGQMGGGGSTGGQGGTGQTGAGGSTGQQQLTAHVVVATENQLQFVSVDPKNNKVLNMQNRPFIQNLWAPQGGMGGSTGGTSGMQDQSQTGGRSGQGGSTGMQDQTSGQSQTDMQGQTGGAGGTAGQAGMLTTTQAQRIYRLAEQQNVDLHKAIQQAESQTKGKAVAAFLAMPRESGMTGGGAGGSTAQEPSGAGGQQQQQTLMAHVYTVADNQIKMALVDAKSNKVLNVENRQMLSAPWEGRMGTGSPGGTGTGGSTGGTSSGGNGDFPTGSGQGTGAGSLGGQ